MKIMCRGRFLPIVLLVASSWAVEAASLPVQPIAVPFTIDGDTIEQAYVGADWSRKFTVMDPESKEVNGLYLVADKKFTDRNTCASMFFDSTNLYICVLAPFPSDTPPDSKDCVEVHLQPGGKKGKTVFRVVAGLDGRTRCGAYSPKTLAEKPWNPDGIRAAALRDGKCFTVEFSIPFASFGGNAVGKGAWRGNVIRRGASCGGQSSMAPTNREQPDPGAFAALQFGDRKEEESASPLAENLSKRVFVWGGGTWLDNGPSVSPPLHKPELGQLTLSGFRGARAIGAFRVSNLSERHALYNLYVHSANPAYMERVRLREMGYLELRGGEVIPDPIFDLPIGSVLRIPPKSTAIVWVDVDCTGLAVERHRASIRLVPGYSSFEEKLLMLDLRVEKPDLEEIDIPVFYYAQSHRTQAAPLAKDYDFNVLTIAPHMHYLPPDANGNWDFAELDKKIETFVAAGLPKNRIRIMLYSMFPSWAGAGFTKEENRRMRFLDPEWKVRYGARVKAVVRHLREKHGIGYDRILVSTLDEPKGDPDDPSTRGYAAIKGGEFIKSLDPNLRIFCNPWANEPEFLQQYLDLYDVLEPYIRRMMDGKEDLALAKRYRDSGKDIGSYVIYVKQNSVHQYRRPFWANLDYGFGRTSAVYGLTAASGDQFNSYDCGKSGSASDWNAGYRNARTGQITPGRRLESWYQGLVDFKLVLWCRRRIAAHKANGRDMTAMTKQLDALIHESNAPHGDLESSRARLLAIANGL